MKKVFLSILVCFSIFSMQQEFNFDRIIDLNFYAPFNRFVEEVNKHTIIINQHIQGNIPNLLDANIQSFIHSCKMIIALTIYLQTLAPHVPHQMDEQFQANHQENIHLIGKLERLMNEIAQLMQRNLQYQAVQYDIRNFLAEKEYLAARMVAFTVDNLLDPDFHEPFNRFIEETNKHEVIINRHIQGNLPNLVNVDIQSFTHSYKIVLSMSMYLETLAQFIHIDPRHLDKRFRADHQENIQLINRIKRLINESEDLMQRDVRYQDARNDIRNFINERKGLAQIIMAVSIGYKAGEYLRNEAIGHLRNGRRNTLDYLWGLVPDPNRMKHNISQAEYHGVVTRRFVAGFLYTLMRPWTLFRRPEPGVEENLWVGQGLRFLEFITQRLPR